LRASNGGRERLAVRITGLVQGVGFRPFVYLQATARGLAGWVRNGRGALEVEIEGGREATGGFLAFLRSTPPAAARIDGIDVVPRPLLSDLGFRIVESDLAAAGDRRSLPAPDRATCADCRAEVLGSTSRRAGYAFTACAVCGPRYSMIEALPYDRARTTLGEFPMCDRCATEYADPADRRFHAEAIACPSCGPSLALRIADGSTVAREAAALAGAVSSLHAGAIVALKGIGGFQLLVDATNHAAVARLRERKGRPEKPFAVLVATLAEARGACEVSDEEAALLLSAAAPIVLLDRRRDAPLRLSESVAPGLGRLGLLLPTTPLHELVASQVGRPLVCTSGNVAEEPLCIADDEALARLARVADVWLTHDRAIVRPIDDSVVQVASRGPEMLRRARGFAPVQLPAPSLRGSVLAFGGHLKATVTLLAGGRFIVGEHVGDLASPGAAARLERSAADLCELAGAEPQAIACDAHPDFVSTRVARAWAETRRIPLIEVQHHHAHAAAGLAEHGIDEPALALVWDGAGLGDDGTLWGGEALLVVRGHFRRKARLRPFPLPGGARAARDPVLSLVGMATVVFGGAARAWLSELGVSGAGIDQALEIALRPTFAPATSSVGRLFDGVSALLGVRRQAGYEAVAAMMLEQVADEHTETVEGYPLPLVDRGEDTPAELDFAPLLRAVAADRAAGVPVAACAARFHEALAEAAVSLVSGEVPVVLSGGCFQNRRLSQRVRARLEAAGRRVYSPRQVPVNDGGLSLGQAAVAAWRLAERR